MLIEQHSKAASYLKFNDFCKHATVSLRAKATRLIKDASSFGAIFVVLHLAV